jgi:hypothetical protein
MALRTNKRVVLNTTESHRFVRDHVRQDQLSAARCTTHLIPTALHVPSAHPIYWRCLSFVQDANERMLFFELIARD